MADEKTDGILTYAGEDFDALIANGITLVDFWATWCVPCQQQGQVLATRVAPEVAGTVKIVKVNVDDYPQLAATFSVQSIPAMFLFKDGHQIAEFQGFTRPAEILEAIPR